MLNLTRFWIVPNIFKQLAEAVVLNKDSFGSALEED